MSRHRNKLSMLKKFLILIHSSKNLTFPKFFYFYTLKNRESSVFKLTLSKRFEYTGCPRRRVPKLNGYNFLNIHGRGMKQKLAES